MMVQMCPDQKTQQVIVSFLHNDLKKLLGEQVALIKTGVKNVGIPLNSAQFNGNVDVQKMKACSNYHFHLPDKLVSFA